MSRQRTTRAGTIRQAVLVVSAATALALTGCASNRAAGQPGESSPAPASTSSAAAPVSSAAASVSSAVAPASSTAAPVGSTAAPVSSATASVSSAQSAPTTTESESTQAPSPQPAKAPIANAVIIDTPGMSYQVSGPLRPGVAAITLVNSDDVTHMMAIGRMKDGVTLKQLTDALDKSEDAAGALLADSPDTAYGTPSLVGAGKSTTVTAMDLPAGHYALICFLQTSDGMPHYKMGMIGELTVTGDKATEMPASDGTITIDDKSVTLPDGFNGSGTFEVVNNGKSPHGFSLARLDQGTALADYAGHVGMAENAGKPVDGGGGVLAGGVDVLGPGQSAFLTVNLQPGHYGYLSPEDMTGPQLPAQSGEFDVH